MRLLLSPVAAGLFAIGAVMASPAMADVNPIHYVDPAAFHALGPIDQVTNFDAFAEDDSTVVANPYVDGDLTLTTDQNVVIGKEVYASARNGFGNNFLSPIDVSIDAAGYTLLSFQITNLFGAAGTTIYLYTDAGFYALGVANAPVADGFAFHGFLAPDNEYFTGLKLIANDADTALVVSEFELGHVAGRIDAAVPEPSTWALMILGFGSVGASLRARRRLHFPTALAR